MDFDSSSSSSDEEDQGNYQRRAKTFRPRINFNLPDLLPRFRFTQEGIQRILDRIRPDIQHPTDCNMALSPSQQLALTLRYLGGSGFMLAIGDAHGPSKATVSRAVHRVVTAINNRFFDDTIGWPNDINEVIVKFYNKNGVPSVVGAIDGTHVPIKKPSENERQFINRHNQPSINCMMVSGPKYKFYYVSLRWPGSVSDARVLRLSTLAERFNAGWRPNGAPANSVLIGDSGYGLSNWLITPITDNDHLTATENRFNDAHRKTRQIVECSFGILKKRFACLKELRLDPVFAGEVIKTCAILHNLSIIERPLAQDEIDEAIQLINENNQLVANDNEIGPLLNVEVGIQRRLSMVYHFAQDFYVWSDPDFGNCFTFNHKKGIHHVTDRAGAVHGLIMLLNTSEAEYLKSSLRGGLILLTKNQNDTLIPDEYFNLPPDYILDVPLDYQAVQRLPSPYGNCMSKTTSENYFYDGDYSAEGCQNTCQQKAVMKKCGCTDPSYPLPPTFPQMHKACTLLSRDCVLSVANSSNLFSNCSCGDKCFDQAYIKSLTLTKMRNFLNLEENEKIAAVNVYHKRMLYLYLQEKPAYSFELFYSDITNVIGNNLEVAFHSVIEFIAMIALIIHGILNHIPY